MKELVLHIGCPKTGSSALQTWLAINQSKLGEQGYYFAVVDKDAKNFKINSGNAGLLDTYIRQVYGQATSNESRDRAILDLYFSDFDKAIISSEILSGFSINNITKLKVFFDQHNIKVKVIAYVRNLYDFFYSAHVQHVKRTNRLLGFERAAREEKDFKHFLSYRNFSQFFDVTLIHYDSVIDNLAMPFCDVADLDYAKLTPLPKKQVNRTLSRDEVEVVQYLGRRLEDMKIVANDFSMVISDDLVHEFPEIESETVYDEKVYQHLSKQFGDQVDAFNAVCENRFDFKISILSDRSYQSQTEDQPLDRETLERVVDIICKNSVRIDRKIIEGLAEYFSTGKQYQSLSKKLMTSLAWKNRGRQIALNMKRRIFHVFLVASNRKLLLLRLREKSGVFR